MKNFLTELNEYFDETPTKEILLDWSKSESFDEVGMTCDDFLEQTNQFNNMNEEQNDKMTINKILQTIDISKIDMAYSDYWSMFADEFDIHYYVNQPVDDIRLTSCFYHSWICTDTRVGIEVWYFNGRSVCISWRPYRKTKKVYGWLSKQDFDDVRNYAISLVYGDYTPNILTDEVLSDVIEKFNDIEHKYFEVKNVKS